MFVCEYMYTHRHTYACTNTLYKIYNIIEYKHLYKYMGCTENNIYVCICVVCVRAHVGCVCVCMRVWMCKQAKYPCYS